jgi:hypothetical protein
MSEMARSRAARQLAFVEVGRIGFLDAPGRCSETPSA